MRLRDSKLHLIFFFAIAATAALLFSRAASGPQLDPVRFLNDAETKTAREIIADRRCPCGCGRYLPGSSKIPACFGCSVGKADITRILEGLAAGRARIDIIFEIDEPVLVDVFADYTTEGLATTWKRASRVAGELGQHRVVLRTPGRTAGARRAVRLAECARLSGKFTSVQAALIDHGGPWDVETLVALAEKAGMGADGVRRCLEEVDVGAQINKDREHAKLRKVRAFPAVSVNSENVADTEDAIRRAIEKVVWDDSI